ncbi:MAG TPA: hypothetical protein PK280_08370 [Planctomycetota bacterium]|nr:hypothetical protein [Planctomycetota bacterium]
MVSSAPQASDAVKLLARAVDHHAVEAVGGGSAGVKAGLGKRHEAADGVGREVDEVLAGLGVLDGAGDEVQELVAGLLHALDEVDALTGLLDLPLDAQAVEGVGRTGQPIALPEVDVGYVPARVADGQEFLEAGPRQDAAGDSLVLAPGLALHELDAVAVGGGADGFLLFVDGAFLAVR